MKVGPTPNYQALLPFGSNVRNFVVSALFLRTFFETSQRILFKTRNNFAIEETDLQCK